MNTRYITYALAAIVACQPGGVTAQQAAPEEQVYEEVVVTAFKRTQNVQDVPSAVSVVGGQEIEDRGITDFHDIQYAVPSLHYSEYFGNANISIRGIGDFAGNPGVSVSMDGVYQPTSVTSKLAQLDLERIEVLRGPQGTLYGRNSNGGVVNVISRKPTAEGEGYIRLGYAEYEELNVAAAYGRAITDGTGFRIAVDHTTSNEGWIENQAPGFDDLMQGDSTTMRARLVSELSDSATLDLIYARAESDGSFNHIFFFTDDREVTDPIYQALNITQEPFETFSPIDDDYDREYDVFSASLNWEIGSVTLDSISAHQSFEEQFTADGAAYDVLAFDFDLTDNETRTFSQELRLSGATDSLDWIFGLYYMDIESEFFTDIIFPIGGLELPPGTRLVFDNFDYDTESTAFFFDATWSVSDTTRLSIGARRTEDEITFEGEHTLVLGPGFEFPICEASHDFTEKSTTLRAAAHHDLTDNGSVYVSYSEGFKAGGVARFECNPPYAPEEIDAWEIGTKWISGDGKITLSAAVFHYDYADFQVAQVVGLATVIRNAGDAKIMGGELEIRSALNENWAINGQITLLDSEYEDFMNLDAFNSGLGFQQLKGNELNKTPKASVNLGVEYSTQLEGGSSLIYRADVSYRSRTYFREFNEREDSQDAYTVVDLNIIWESADGAWNGRLYASNLTDEEYTQDLSGDATAGGRLGQWGMPRQIGVSATRKF